MKDFKKSFAAKKIELKEEHWEEKTKLRGEKRELQQTVSEGTREEKFHSNTETQSWRYHLRIPEKEVGQSRKQTKIALKKTNVNQELAQNRLANLSTWLLSCIRYWLVRVLYK